jgi:hypothetical protein
MFTEPLELVATAPGSTPFEKCLEPTHFKIIVLLPIPIS